MALSASCKGDPQPSRRLGGWLVPRALFLRLAFPVLAWVSVMGVAPGLVRAETSCERYSAAVKAAIGRKAKIAAAKKLSAGMRRMGKAVRATCARGVEPLLRGVLVRWVKAGAAAEGLAMSDLWLSLFVATDPSHASMVRFTRASLLYKLSRWRMAALAYGALAGLPRYVPRQRLHSVKDRRAALRRAVLAWQHIVSGWRRASRRGRASKAQRIPDRAAMFAAFDAFIAQNSRGSAEAAKVLFGQGRLLYDYGHLRAAVKIFGQVVARYSRQASARSAATLILDALQRAGHEDELLRWTKKLAKSPVATPKLKESIRRIELSARFRRARQASEKKKWARCVSGFLAIASQAPKSKWAPMALYTAALCRRQSKKLLAAAALMERLLRTYPNDTIAQRVRFALAGLRHLVGRHADAARLYERYAKGATKGDRQVVSGLLYAVTVAVRKRKRRHAKDLVMLLRRLAPHDGRALKQAQELLAKL